MPDLSEFDPVTIGDRIYLPLLMLDSEGRRNTLRLPGPTPGSWREPTPYACTDCADLTLDPVAHNLTHDGPACRICGCTESNACLLGLEEAPWSATCHWVEPDLCSNPECVAAATAAGKPVVQTVDLVAALRQSVEAAKARREGRSAPEGEVQR